MRFWRRGRNAEQPGGDIAVVAGEPDLGGEPGDLLEFDAEYTPEEQSEVVEQTSRAVERTRRGWFSRLGGLFERSDFGDDLWDELEEILVASDAGVSTTTAILDRVRERVRRDGVKQSAVVRDILRDELIAILDAPSHEPPAWAVRNPPSPLVMLIVGVNGAGKTTSIAKLAHAFKRDGATVILGAADTFRAAAIDQLKVWGERAGVRVVANQPGSDPAAVAFDTVSAAESARAEIVIIDTAGRLHSKSNLMDELKKVSRIVDRKVSGAPHETLLVLDATTGQNGLMQARTFTDAVGVTGIVLAKLDGTAKGGIAFAIVHELGIPVRFIGTGERMDDLSPFDARAFVDSLLA